MSYVVCRAEKLKTAGNVGGSAAHIQRTRPTPNADPDRTGLNRVLVGAAGDDIPALVRARIADYGLKTRKNSVLAFEVILSASPDYFRPEAPEVSGTWDAARLEPWVDASQKWLREKYGSRLISAVLHLDEETPHIHAVVVPVDEKNSLNCRAFLGNRKLLSQLQTDAGNAFKHLGLDRGVERSGAKHTKIKEYYAAVNSKFEIVPPVETPMPVQPGPEPTPPLVFFGPAARDKFAAELESWKTRKAHYDAQLKKRNEEIRVANTVAHRLAAKYQAQAADSKFKEKEMKALRAENSRLAKKLDQAGAEVEALKALTAELRGADLVDVLQRIYGATEDASSKPAHRTRKFKVPSRSASVAVTGELWADNATGDGGKGAINLVLQLEGWGQDRFKDAVRVLAEHFRPGEVAAAVGRRQAVQALAEVEAAKAQPLPPVDLAPVQATWVRVQRYLTQVRRLPPHLVEWARERGLLHSDARANAVFVLHQGAGCFRRGSYDPADRPAFRQTQRPAGSRLPYVLPGSAGADVWVCEGPIDALSIKAVHRSATVIATGGNTDPAKLREIVAESLASGGRLVLGHDSDESGHAQAAKLAKALGGEPIRAEVPAGAKDWNEALQAQPGLVSVGMVLAGDGQTVTAAQAAELARCEAAEAARVSAPVSRSRQR